MKYFFLFFLYIGVIFCTNSSLSKADEALNDALSRTPNLADLFKNGMDSNSLLSQKKGIGNWIKTPYGKIRLLSRESGTKGLNKILMALEVKIDSNVIIKNPDLKINQSQNVKDSRFFIPMPQPFQKEGGLIYEKETVFPFFLSLQKESSSVFVSVDFSAQYCTQESCNTDLKTLFLSIPNEHNYFTPFSAFIDSSFRFIPAEATAKQIQMGALSENTFWIVLQLKKTIQQPQFLFLDSKTQQPILYTQNKSDIDNNRSLFIFKTEENIENRNITLYLSDKKQFFTQTKKLIKTPIPSFLHTDKNIIPPFYLWLVFLLFSPCLSLLFQQRPRNEIIAKQVTIKNLLGITLGILCGIFIYSIIPYETLANSRLWLSFGFLLFGFLGFFSYPITPFGYGFLTAIVPFFFFFKNMDIQIPATFSELTHFFCVIAILNALPFMVFLMKPYWLVKLGRTFENQAKYKLRFSLFLDAILFGLILLFA